MQMNNTARSAKFKIGYQVRDFEITIQILLKEFNTFALLEIGLPLFRRYP